ncbi:hypothetical protein F511_13604 [Dorcoceras hygrometricum]|uniref:Uncharacterized protein n=1 Tax=Dorcoceras hygrometricum TaxID=472368 RepID=A0A2Z7CA26_9LAMI|nr:hypothetical protein F511_13604 [Dorcoceras hygrometricum]
MSGRGRARRSNPLEETESDNNANITQLLRMLVEQNNNRGNGQSSSSRGPSNDDPQEKFRRQKPKEFTGTTDPLIAECWIKSMELSKKMMNSRRICPADGSANKDSAVGLVFMESAAGLAMETSKVESAVRNQAESKVEPAGA